VSLLHTAVATEASDLHLVVGYPPTLRIHGRLRPLEQPCLDDAAVRAMARAVSPDLAWGRFVERQNADFSCSVDCGEHPARFRVSLFQHQGEFGACFRHVPDEIPTLDWAGFPAEIAERILALRNGLVLFTGVTGSGKTTSMAILVKRLSAQQDRRIITIEEPVEYVFPRTTGSLITQREVGVDVASFYEGLKSGLRQDPDVMLVGEIRDHDTAQIALSAAETGHLIFATVHTLDTRGAITRIADLFPSNQQEAVRSQLSLSLRCVISQHLLPAVRENERRVLAVEALFNNYAVASAIRLGKIEAITSALQTGKRDGMVTLDESLRRLLEAGRISVETARRYAADPESLTAPRRS
ncbi:MAG: PilT/PilU family type 4a pilus ATPase, partial [Phycisphaerae bacterium]|nr:PilT/PilU family type 4a pilus ATPase [Phycisphaerae bacterium]